MKNFYIQIIALVLISGCESSDHSTVDDVNNNEIKASSILDAQIDALDKAKLVENSILDAAQERDKVMQE